MYIQEKGANRNICQQVCCITFGETSSGPVFGNEIEKKRFLDMLLNAIQDLKINVYAYCVLDYEAYILATADGRKKDPSGDAENKAAVSGTLQKEISGKQREISDRI